MTPLDKFFQEFVGRAIDLNLFSRSVERLRFRPLTYRCVLHDALHHRIGHLAASATIAAEPPAVTCGGAFRQPAEGRRQAAELRCLCGKRALRSPHPASRAPHSNVSLALPAALGTVHSLTPPSSLGRWTAVRPALCPGAGAAPLVPTAFGQGARCLGCTGEIDRLNGGNLPCGRLSSANLPARHEVRAL